MLGDEVREDVIEGKFHVFAVERVEEGIELLTGVPAGQPNEDGEYTPGTINHRIVEQLRAFRRIVRPSAQRHLHEEGEGDESTF